MKNDVETDMLVFGCTSLLENENSRPPKHSTTKKIQNVNLKKK